jgi:hypothetical protein
MTLFNRRDPKNSDDSSLNNHLCSEGRTRQKLLSASANNTLPMRPGSYYRADVVTGSESLPPAFTILLLYSRGCEIQPLYRLTKSIEKELQQDITASSIAFEYKYVNVCEVENVTEGLPRLFKIRRNGEVLEYTKGPYYGAIRDWVLNEGLLA